MRKYLIFNSQNEANVAIQQINSNIGLTAPQYNKNAMSGNVDIGAQPTVTWAIPIQILDGRWIIPSPDGTGTAPQESWFPKL